MVAVWANDLQGQMNITLAFALDLETAQAFDLTIAAADCYKIYADGQFLAFGPQRAAHGYARIAKYKGRAKRIVVEVHSHFANTFCWIKQPPFFACEVSADGVVYTAENFTCYHLTDRVQRVQRYSYQRGFAEVYCLDEDRTSLYCGTSNFPKKHTQRVHAPAFLPSWVDEPKYTMHYPQTVIEQGGVDVDPSLPVWTDRSHTLVGTKLDGFAMVDWEERLTEAASRFIYRPNKTAVSGLSYQTYDFGRAMTGFAELKITADREGVVYVIFDELLWHERGKGENYVAFERNACSSVHKFILRKGGQYNVSTFDPYLMRYALLVCSEGVNAEIALRDYENPNADDFTVECADASIQKIVKAAKATFAQNAVDLLTDCPSRERAGWLSDSYFSSEAEYILTGKNQAEKAFLENYAYADCTGLPDGMVPMCYPSDPYDTYIPNWAMWYILELEKYANRWGRDEIIAKSKEKADGVLRYFKRKENEFGLLENLDGWVFVEWSAANDEDHIKGVNIPSNIAYARCLEGMANLYGYEDLRLQAENIRTFIKTHAYDGRFFVDNLIRDEQGNLRQSGLLTEVCQYYAFWFNCITKEEYPWLYEELMERLGVNRAEGYLPEVGISNVLYGLYMRVDLLMREGKKAKVLDECLRLFLPMAERTGTLWEHNGISASCNHGFASYALKWILFALDK
ncbi:MAG: hypothetical protein E7371_04920 [Clostridiales bacterium]|nr:hypothetical protein [Clostridiales bacterium]